MKDSKFTKFLNRIHFKAILIILGLYLVLCFVCWLTLRGSAERQTFWDVILWNLLAVAGNDYAFVDNVSSRLVGILILMFSMFGLSAITGYISSALVERKINPERGLKKVQGLKNHIIICGWKNDIKILITDILRKNKKIHTEDIVLINTVEEVKLQALKDDETLKGIHYIHGDFTEEQTLMNANAKAAGKVLILGENQESLDAELVDSRVFVATLMLRNINPKCHICAEVKTERYKNYLEAQNTAEVIYTDAYTRYILSTSTNYSGMSKVMSAFLDNGDGVSVQIKPIDEKWIGKTFGELAGWYKHEKNFIVLGVLENMGVEKELKHQILSDATKSTNYGEILEKLKNVKNLETNYPHLNPEDTLVLQKNMGAIILGEEI